MKVGKVGSVGVCHLLTVFLLGWLLLADPSVGDGSFGGNRKNAKNMDHLSSAEATTLFLKEGEKPRDNDDPVGGGLLTQHLEADVVVAGGGSAGTSAALASARSGAKTILIQGRGVLGGNASSESKLHMVGADRHGDRGIYRKTETREGGIVEEYTLKNAVDNGQRSHSIFDLILYDMFRTEPNVQLILNAWVVAANKTPAKGDTPGTVTEIIAENQESQLRYVIKGKVFIDATGDGRLGAEAGVPYIIGRESQKEYNETLAEPEQDAETMGSSLAFVARNHSQPMKFEPPSWAIRYSEEDFRYRPIKSGDLMYGYWWIEVAWPFHTIRQNEEIRDTLMEVVLGTWDYIKNSGNFPEAENLALEWLEWWPCKREGRRFRGQYIMTQNDLLPDPFVEEENAHAPTFFWDRVSHAGWNLDLHAVKGVLDTAVPAYASYYIPYVYSTPLRSLVALNTTNVMLAGRLASFSHVVFGSQRVMKTCAAMGQATGTAAAYCALHDIEPWEIANHPDAVWSIQQQLLRDDQYIIGMYNQDPRDYARAARITASSEHSNATAKEVISGQTRAVDGRSGAAPEQRIDGTNRWISETVPAWLKFEWEHPIQDLALVELVFDTGMHRELTLTLKRSMWNRIVWGRPQPETVKDYDIQVQLAGDGKDMWCSVAYIRGNYLRKRVHDISHAVAKLDNKGEGVKAIRVFIKATNGVGEAQVFEVRVYDKYGVDKFPKKPNGDTQHGDKPKGAKRRSLKGSSSSDIFV
ncbi:unnamed protein product [Vitrella brassicaformis CCMP3155]|uniref:FAD dependent oxidoreductase n=2 Tax=Vitrella brassicaformis TaxID=1169539 RepID=A0A0G4FK18_VITBC|nr:unnamed protein product [Vitrella brassicaformis CCMP3155]|eukprot:CEM14129.1 unnamed protein product [Vitrella brassicaformis CCMP3155]